MCFELWTMASTSAAKCTRTDAGEWKHTKNTDGIPPLGSSIHNCDCSACKTVMKDTAQWTSMQKEDTDIVIKIGDRVLVHGCLPGVVRYVGDLDSNCTNDQIYIGVKLDEPVGNSDGTFNNKRYFTCPENHGIIVPIEKVHILVPRDGRSIPIYVANRFYSLPEMSELDSMTSEGFLQRGFSDSYVSSSHPTPGVSPKMSLEDLCPLEKDPKGSSQEHMNRSAVFICQEAGSIAAGIEVPDDVKSMIELIRDPKKTSKENQAVATSEAVEKTPEESNGADTDMSKNEKLITATKFDDTKSTKDSNIVIDSVKKIEQKQTIPGETTLSTKVPPAFLACKNVLATSSSAPNAGTRVDKVQLTTSQSASGSVNVNIKSTNLCISKLATTSSDASSQDSSQKPTTNNDEEMQPKDIELDNPDVSPSETQKLELVPITKQVDSDKEATFSLVSNPSYTSHLLSSLPVEDIAAQLTTNTQLSEVLQFGDWVNIWGGGMKGWVMAQTLQKLKDAQRKGVKEIQWQKSVDDLEFDEEFGPRIRHIRTLREKIGMVQKMQAEVEQELREKKIALSSSELCKEIEAIEEETKAVQKMNEELVRKLQESFLSPNFEALEKFRYLSYLGLEL